MRKISKRRQEMGEEAWKLYQQARKQKKSFKYYKSNVDKVINWRVRVKQKLIEYKGGKCIKCGYDKVQYASAFCFHHRNPKEKEFTLSAKTISFDRIKAEADKCDLMCVRCHAELHSEEYNRSRFKTIESHSTLV